MAFGLSKNRVKRYSKTYRDLIQYKKPKCIFSIVPHFDIPRFVLLHSMSTNCSERRSISLGLKNIMIYVITFLIMTGKKCKTIEKNIILNSLSCIFAYRSNIISLLVIFYDMYIDVISDCKLNQQ